MANLPETSSFDSVYQFETSDPIQGGPDGVDNLPHKQLTNRTKWLNDNKLNLSGGTMTGKLSINLSAADDGLSVQSLSGANAVIRLKQTGLAAGSIKAVAGAGITFGSDTGTGDTERMRIDGSGNVAIGGSDTSLARLTVQAGSNGPTGVVVTGIGTSAVTSDIRVLRTGVSESDNAGRGSCIQLQNTTNNTAVLLQHYGNNLQFLNFTGSSWTERMRIDASGRVGIGTNAPAGKMEVVGGEIVFGDGASLRSALGYRSGLGYLRAMTSAGADNYASAVAGGGDITQSRGAYVFAKGNNYSSLPGELQLVAGSVSGAPITFYTGGSVSAALTYAGRFGVGAGTSPVSTLDVRSSSSSLPGDTPTLATLVNNGTSTSSAAMALIGGASGISALWLGDSASSYRGAVNYTHSTDLLNIWAGGDSSGAAGNRITIGGGGVIRATHPSASDDSLQLATTGWVRDLLPFSTGIGAGSVGSQKIADGLAMRWGVQYVGNVSGGASGSTGRIYFDTPFDNACLFAIPSMTTNNGSSAKACATINAITTTYVDWKIEEWEGVTQDLTISVVAFGY